jgi:hypothetical protein
MKKMAKQQEKQKSEAAPPAGEQAGAGPSYAQAAATSDENITFTIYQTDHSHQPVHYQNYLEIKRLLSEYRAAEVISDVKKGVVPKKINFTVLPLDPETRGMPMTVKNKLSYEWVVNILTTIVIDEVIFKAWLPNEKPKSFEFQLYLSEAHNNLEVEHIMIILKTYNEGLPADWKFAEEVEQTDRQGHDKGRIFNLTAGTLFHEYCKLKGFRLEFIGGWAPCQTPEEKVRLANIKKRE